MIVLHIIFSSKINEEILFQTRRRVYNCQGAFWQLVFTGEGTHSFINSHKQLWNLFLKAQ